MERLTVSSIISNCNFPFTIYCFTFAVVVCLLNYPVAEWQGWEGGMCPQCPVSTVTALGKSKRSHYFSKRYHILRSYDSVMLLLHRTLCCHKQYVCVPPPWRAGYPGGVCKRSATSLVRCAMCSHKLTHKPKHSEIALDCYISTQIHAAGSGGNMRPTLCYSVRNAMLTSNWLLHSSIIKKR